MHKLAIIGCGPAGLAFASAMVDSNYEIVILERTAQARATGSGFILQPTGLAIAEMLGIRLGLEQVGHRITRVTGRTVRGNHIVIDVDYSLIQKTPYSVGLHRATLFNALFNQVQNNNIPVITNCDIREYITLPNGKVQLKNNHGELLGPFDLVVDASGLKSTLRAQVFGKQSSKILKYGSLWAKLNLPDGIFEKHILQQRFACSDLSIGIMPIGCESIGKPQQAALFWNIDSSKFDAVKSEGLNLWKESVVDLWPDCAGLLDQIESFEQLTLAQYRHHTSTPLYAPGIVFIGDAAHSTNPLLGQGVNMALVDAMTLAQALQCEEDLIKACKKYAQQRRWHIRTVQILASTLIPFYKSNDVSLATLRNYLFRPLSSLPYMNKFIALMVSGLITNPLKDLQQTPTRLDIEQAGLLKQKIN